MYQHISEFQQFLQKEGAAAAFLRLPENLVLFSQYWPRHGFSFIFIPAEGEPVVICPETEVGDLEEVGISNAIGVGDTKLADGDPYDNAGRVILKLREACNIPDGAKIAIEIGENVIAPTFVSNKVQLVGSKTYAMLETYFKTKDFIPVYDAIQPIRNIKNENDLAKLEIINEAMDKTLDYFEQLLEVPGIREIDVLADTQAYFSKLVCGYKGIRGVARPFAQLSTGPDRSVVAWCEGIISNTRPLQTGDVALFEFSACVDGYWGDHTRTGCVGGFTGQKRIIMEILETAFDLARAAAKDGATGHDVDKACRDYIESCGYGEFFVHAAGHGTGFAHSEGTPMLAPGSEDILRTNMVVAIEPAIYIPGLGGFRVERNVVVGPEGGRVLGR